MNDFYDVFIYGFKYLYSVKAFPQIALLIAFFAILKITDFKKGMILIFCFCSGFLVNLLLLSFQIFSIQNKYWSGVLIITTVLFAFWNFGFKASPFRKRSSNISSRYLIAFILGIFHGIYIFFLEQQVFATDQLRNVLGFWSGLFLSVLVFLVMDFILLWIFTNFFRVKEQNWLLVVSGIAMGFAIALYQII